jgi:hypothetical protein
MPYDPPTDPSAGDPQAGAWFETIPAELQADPAIAELKGKPIGDVLTSFRDLSARAAESAPPPTPQDYRLRIPEGIPVNWMGFESLLSTAHAAGMSEKQLQAMVDHQATAAATHLESMRKEAEAGKRALEEKWGNSYLENMELVRRAIATLPKGIIEILETAGLGSHPAFVEMIYMVGEAQSEGRLVKGGAPGQTKDVAERLYGRK